VLVRIRSRAQSFSTTIEKLFYLYNFMLHKKAFTP
jgi:hypothetical protein